MKMLACISGMVDKTRKAIGILEERENRERAMNFASEPSGRSDFEVRNRIADSGCLLNTSAFIN